MKTQPLKRRFRLGAFAVLAATALVLTACAGGNESPDPGESEAPVAVVDTVRIDIPQAPSFIDPLGGTLLVSNQIVSLTSASLFNFERGSASQTVPYLAESVTASEDGLVHTVVLRPDLAFSDGSVLDSEDVVASLTRLRDTPGPNARFGANFADVQAVDADTVEITLSSPLADLSGTLALPATAIVSKAAVGVEDYFGGEPVFSGPYVPEGDPFSNSFKLVANEHFGGDTPIVKTLEFSVIPDSSTSATRLQAGDTDMAEIPLESRSLMTGETEALTLQRTASFYLLPNNREGALFSDPKIRQAMATAIDREPIATAAFGDGVAVQTGPFLPMSDYPEPVQVFAEPDLDAARDLLKGTACEDGCTASLNYFASDTLTTGRGALVLQQQLAEIGIDLQPEPVESALFIENSLDGSFEINIGTSGSFNVQETFLGAFTTEGNKCVYTGCANPDWKPATQALLTATTEADREDAARDVIEIFADWVPIIPIAGETATRGIRIAVEDVIQEQPNGMFWLAVE